MNKTKQKILEAISEICIEKNNARIVPAHAMHPEVFERVIPSYVTGVERIACLQTVQNALNELVLEGHLEWGKTINYNYFKPKPRG